MTEDRTNAQAGLISFRVPGPEGWIVFSARDLPDALREAQRLTEESLTVADLRVWCERQGAYIPIQDSDHGKGGDFVPSIDQKKLLAAIRSGAIKLQA